MKSTLFVGAFILAIGIFVRTEGAVFSMVASGIDRLITSLDQTLFDGDRVHDLPDSSRFSLLAAGDIAACYVGGILNRINQNLLYTLGLAQHKPEPNRGMVATSRILEQHSDLNLLALGDLAYKRGAPVAFRDCYDPYWGSAKARTWPTPGNHEYRSLGAYGYYDYWKERAGPDRAGYYALRADNWILLSLNSEIDASEGSPQTRWIDDTLAAHKGKCVGAFYHKPAFSAVDRRNSTNARLLFARLAEAGAIFVLNGHNHFYERTVPLDAMGREAIAGTTIFIAGAGGKMTVENIPPNHRTAELITGTSGVLKLDFVQRSMNWAYLTEVGLEAASKGTLACPS